MASSWGAAEGYRHGRVASRRTLSRVGFIVTNMSRPAERVVAFYNKRGTCEQWIKEGKGAIKWTRLSCRTFAANTLNPHCTTRGMATVRVTKQPEHGKIETTPAISYPNYSKDHARYKRNQHRVKGVQVNYKPAEKYVGEDAFELLIIWPNGFAWELHYDVSVR
jgi:hypothetical protein